jgi:hypothetical protein
LREHQRRLTSIAPSGNIWEGTIYGADGRVIELIFGTKAFIEERLSRPLPPRATRERLTDSGEFECLALDLDGNGAA